MEFLTGKKDQPKLDIRTLLILLCLALPGSGLARFACFLADLGIPWLSLGIICIYFPSTLMLFQQMYNTRTQK